MKHLFFVTLCLVLAFSSCKNKETKPSETPAAGTSIAIKKEKHFTSTFTYEEVKENKKLTDHGCLCQMHLDNDEGSVVFMDNRLDYAILKLDGKFQEFQAVKAEERIKDEIVKEYKNDTFKVLFRGKQDKSKKYDSAGLYVGEIHVIENSGDTIYKKTVYGLCGC
jgi:hypothetical protein